MLRSKEVILGQNWSFMIKVVVLRSKVVKLRTKVVILARSKVVILGKKWSFMIKEVILRSKVVMLRSIVVISWSKLKRSHFMVKSVIYPKYSF